MATETDAPRDPNAPEGKLFAERRATYLPPSPVMMITTGATVWVWRDGRPRRATAAEEYYLDYHRARIQWSADREHERLYAVVPSDSVYATEIDCARAHSINEAVTLELRKEEHERLARSCLGAIEAARLTAAELHRAQARGATTLAEAEADRLAHPEEAEL